MDEEEKFVKGCKFLVIFNHKHCCLWPAILFTDKQPEPINECSKNCVMRNTIVKKLKQTS